MGFVTVAANLFADADNTFINSLLGHTSRLQNALRLPIRIPAEDYSIDFGVPQEMDNNETIWLGRKGGTASMKKQTNKRQTKKKQ